MNKSYDRCSRCSRRKLLTTGYLRKWLKPGECKHLQRSIDHKRDINDPGIVSCVLLAERKAPVHSNKFIKFCKSNILFNSTVKSLHRYFTNKSQENEFRNTNKPDDGIILSDKQVKSTPTDSKKECDSTKSSMKCNHWDGRVVLRGHEKHMSPESCAIYCQLSKHGWYWGGITSSEAEELLAGQHDNVFLVRDSFSSHHLLCVSFRCVGRTLHARLRHSNGLFSLNNETFVPANRLSEHCATVDVGSHLFEGPVRLARPLNRFAKLDSLQMICRFVIRQSVSNPDDFQKLPLPPNLIMYISSGSDYIISGNI